MSCARRAAVSAFLLLWPTLAFAQDAELRGVIRDQSGAIVPGASVTVLAPTTGARRAITSDAAGRYVFSFLSPGDYDITAELNGFQPVTRTGISLDTGKPHHARSHAAPRADQRDRCRGGQRSCRRIAW